MEKKVALRRWQNLTPDQPIIPHFTPIAADARGSTFGACGIRISGNPEFIDAVLSRLKDLLSFEAGSTRLSLSRQPVKTVAIAKGDSVVEKQWRNADTDAETCYIQVRERTAKTRQRKVREMSAPLPSIEAEPTNITNTLTGISADAEVHSSNDAEGKADNERPDSGFFIIQDDDNDTME